MKIIKIIALISLVTFFGCKGTTNEDKHKNDHGHSHDHSHDHSHEHEHGHTHDEFEIHEHEGVETLKNQKEVEIPEDSVLQTNKQIYQSNHKDLHQ